MPQAAQFAWPAAGSYHYLDKAGPADLAWEWLRRDPKYQRLAHDRSIWAGNGLSIFQAASADWTARWGCLTQPDPGLNFAVAPVLWSAAVDPSVLRVLVMRSCEPGARFDLRDSRVPTALVTAGDCEHVLLGRGGTTVRLDVVAGSLLDGPVSLAHDLALADEPAMAALRRFLHFCRVGVLPAYSPPASQRLGRQAVILRVADALAQGASIRDVGIMLYGAERVSKEWADEALKSQCRRLIAMARAMMRGGYKSLLRLAKAEAFVI